MVPPLITPLDELLDPEDEEVLFELVDADAFATLVKSLNHLEILLIMPLDGLSGSIPNLFILSNEPKGVRLNNLAEDISGFLFNSLIIGFPLNSFVIFFVKLVNIPKGEPLTILSIWGLMDEFPCIILMPDVFIPKPEGIIFDWGLKALPIPDNPLTRLNPPIPIPPANRDPIIADFCPGTLSPINPTPFSIVPLFIDNLFNIFPNIIPVGSFSPLLSSRLEPRSDDIFSFKLPSFNFWGRYPRTPAMDSLFMLSFTPDTFLSIPCFLIWYGRKPNILAILSIPLIFFGSLSLILSSILEFFSLLGINPSPPNITFSSILFCPGIFLPNLVFPIDEVIVSNIFPLRGLSEFFIS